MGQGRAARTAAGDVAAAGGRRWGAVVSRQRGFTLLEVLLATTLLAAGLALAFAILRTAAATTERGDTISARNERIRAVSAFLQRRLGGAQGLVYEVDPASGQSRRFDGQPDALRFVADLPDYLGRGGPHLHALTLGRGPAGIDLNVAFHMVQAGVSLPAARPPEPLADALAVVRFSYRSVTSHGQPGPWLETWEQVDAMPLQVRVQVTDARGAWPDMVVALPVGGSFMPSEMAP